MRISNKMDPGFDSRASAGYRDLALNLRLVTPATERLGADTHVCEVQLILREIAELKVGAPPQARRIRRKPGVNQVQTMCKQV